MVEKSEHELIVLLVGCNEGFRGDYSSSMVEANNELNLFSRIQFKEFNIKSENYKLPSQFDVAVFMIELPGDEDYFVGRE